MKRDISRAVARYNEARGLTYPSVGYLQYADIRGDGGAYRPGFYVCVNASGGVGSAYGLRGDTLRETLANVEAAIVSGKESFR